MPEQYQKMEALFAKPAKNSHSAPPLNLLTTRVSLDSFLPRGCHFSGICIVITRACTSRQVRKADAISAVLARFKYRNISFFLNIHVYEKTNPVRSWFFNYTLFPNNRIMAYCVSVNEVLLRFF